MESTGYSPSWSRLRPKRRVYSKTTNSQALTQKLNVQELILSLHVHRPQMRPEQDESLP